MATTIAELQARVTADVSQAEKSLQSVQQHLGDTKDHFLSGAQSVLGFVTAGAGLVGIQAGIQGIVNAGLGLFQMDSSVENTTSAFTKLLGSSKAAHDEIADLQAFSASTPLELPDVEMATQKLLGYQFQLKETKPILTAVGDALAATGNLNPATLQQVVNVFGQMHATGHIATQDLQQLASVGINGFQVLADNIVPTKKQFDALVNDGFVKASDKAALLSGKMHLTTAEIQDLVTKGLIPSDQGIKTLTDGIENNPIYKGGMAAQSETTAGRISTLKDNLSLAAQKMSMPIFTQLSGIIGKIGDAASSPAFQSFATMIGTTIADGVQKAVDAFHALQPPIQWVRDNGDLVKALLIGLGVGIAVVLVPAFIAWAIAAGAAAIATIAATLPIILIVAGIALLVAGIILLVTHWSQVTAFLQGVWNNVVKGVQIGLQVLGQFFSQLGTRIHDALMGAIAAIVSWVLGVIAKFQEAKTQADNKIREMVSAVIDRIRGAVGGVISAAGSIKDGILNTLGGLKDKLVGLIGDAINNMIGAIKGAAGRVGSAFSGLFGGIHIPGFAEGGVTSGGLVMVGERGPELVALPSGSRVYPHGTGPAGSSVPGSGGGGAGGNTYITNVYPQQAVLDTAELARIQRRQDLLRGMY